MKKKFLPLFILLFTLLCSCSIDDQSSFIVGPEFDNDSSLPDIEPVSIAITEASFPDDVFREYILLSIDKGKDGFITEEEIKNTSMLRLSYREVYDLTGIELFTELTEINFTNCKIESLDLTNNKKLRSITLSDNPLKSLTLSAPGLIALDCQRCGLQSIDLTSCEALETLRLSQNPLSELDLSFNTNLVELDLSLSDIEKAPDLSGCTKLEFLDLSGIISQNIDLSKNSLLKTLLLNNAKLDSIDLSKLSQLTTLECHKNSLTKLDVSALSQLERLVCADNKLGFIDLSKNSQLTYLDIHKNNLSQLDLSNNTKLSTLYCFANSGLAVDTDKLESLTDIKAEQDIIFLDDPFTQNPFITTKILLEQIVRNDFSYSMPVYVYDESTEEYVIKSWYCNSTVKEDFWQGIEFCGYTILSTELIDSYIQHSEVEFDITSSTNPMFEVGKSVWILEVECDEFYRISLYPKDNPPPQIEKNDITDAACRIIRSEFVNQRQNFDNFSDFLSENATDEDCNSFFLNTNRLIHILSKKEFYNLSGDELSQLYKDYLDVTLPQEYISFYENQKPYYTYIPYADRQFRLTDYNYNQSTGYYEVTADIYVDSFRLDTATTIKFCFEENSGKISFVSAEFLYDDGSMWYPY